MNTAGWAAVAALGASALTGLSSMGAVAFQDWRRNRASARQRLHAAVIELLSRSFAFSLQAQTAGDMGKMRSGLGEGLDIVLHIRKPLDHMAFHDWMWRELGPLSEAWSEVWTTGDQEAIRLANRVISCCSDIAGANMARESPETFGHKLRAFTVGERWTDEAVLAIEEGRRQLAEARKDLTLYVRTRLGYPEVEPFA